MKSDSRFSLRALTCTFVLLVVACSDDNGTSGGPPDTTPPSVTTVTAVDAFHVDVTFNENLGRTSAETEGNYVILETVPPPAPVPSGAWPEAPGDTLRVFSASLNTDLRTVSLTTESMSVVPYEVGVTGVADASGNAITAAVVKPFSGTSAPDVTAPEIVYRSPAPNATGVGVGQPVVVQFSEPVTYSSFEGSLAWVSEDGTDAVGNTIYTDDFVRYTVSPTSPMKNGTEYDVSLSFVEDFAGNQMALATWSFTTTSVADNTPPTLVASVPTDGATNVNVNTNLSLTFSEAINQVELLIQLTPDPGDGTVTWSNGGKTLTFDPVFPLTDDQQYTLTIFPDGVRDLAGNGIELPALVRFTTGNALAAGSFAGTLSGDPFSDYADDPTGALVVATDRLIFESDDFNILGSAIVAGNDTYDIRYLPDGVYYPLSVMDSNGDDQIDPESGDAIGLYGVDLGVGDFEADSVTITGGNRVTSVDFPLYDISAITGGVAYDGNYSGGGEFYNIGIGVFDTLGFDPTQQPLYGTFAEWPDFPEWGVNSLDDGLSDGTYYVGAFLDVNGNFSYDPLTEPAGLYGGLADPTPITIDNGSDANGIEITMQDPAPVLATPRIRVAWPAPANRAPWLEKVSAAVRKVEPGAAAKDQATRAIRSIGGSR